jgi:hypothetical protein
VAGTGFTGFSPDGTLATEADFASPFGIVLDNRGNIYVADRSNHVVFKIRTDGEIIRIAGTGDPSFNGDGVATDSKLNRPEGLALGVRNALHIDTGNHRIRKLTDGQIITVAGSDRGDSGDGGQATDAQLDSPRGLAIDGSGRLFIADEKNDRIRVVSEAGIITTLAGTGEPAYSGDGEESVLAQLNRPRELAIESSGHLIVVDSGNRRARRIEGVATPRPRVISSTSRVASDFNEDGSVDFADFLLFAQVFGSTISAYDLDGDGNVAFGDFLIFADFFGS